MKVLTIMALGDVQPGMCLAEALCDETGRVLVPGGCELTENILLGLARREISELKIEQLVEDDPVELEAHRAKVVDELDHLFRQAGDGLETRQLYQVILDYRMESGS